MGEFDAAAEALTEQVKALLPRATNNSDALLAKIVESALAESRNIILMVSIGGGIMLGGLWLLIRAIRPLRSLTDAALRIADNDLTGQIPQTGGQDEIGRLAEAIQAMQGKLTRRIQEIAAVSQEVNAAVETMSAIVEHTSMGVQQQHSETEQVATAMNEMTATVHEVARNTAAAANTLRILFLGSYESFCSNSSMLEYRLSGAGDRPLSTILRSQPGTELPEGAESTLPWLLWLIMS